ncbi:uncharacterized protein LOC142168030 [Nicotiana tabacum]|uniref:Uncharacterized protein LOC142168030 n=1 Tax=Nicotiana tabacum TaxID=4097 RepID=A0AC58SIK2_TOBAC
MKDLSDKHRTDRNFEVGDWVYLKLRPYKQVSMANRPFNNLAAKYFGPYPIEAKVGAIAYRLLLPADALLHHTFYASQLKRCLEVPHVINHPPILHMCSTYCPLPEVVLHKRLVKRGNKVVCQVLVKWTSIEASQATWEYLTDLQHKFSSFHP